MKIELFAALSHFQDTVRLVWIAVLVSRVWNMAVLEAGKQWVSFGVQWIKKKIVIEREKKTYPILISTQ